MLEEVWKDITGYEGHYQVSSTGFVRSVTHKDKNGITRTGKILKHGYTIYGYAIVVLSVNKKRKTKTIHRLVAREFIDNFSETLDVDHIDGMKKNNNISNLRMCNRRQNNFNCRKHAKTKSLYKGTRKTKNNKWSAMTRDNYKVISLGTFNLEKEAALAYDKYVRENFGEYGRYNFPQEGERGIN